MDRTESDITIESVLLRPITHTTWRFWVFAGTLLAIWAFGMYAWTTQLRGGSA